MPNSSFIALSVGVIALVVQLAAEMTLSSGLMSSVLTPNTMFLTFLPGAVNRALAAPLDKKCSLNSASSRRIPVLSTTNALLMPYFV